MSVATISYRSISDSANEAKGVSRKLNTYANHLENQIYNKINGYTGPHSGNIQTAKSQVNAKMSELRSRASAYETYAGDLESMRTACESTDKAVRTMVSGLTAEFKVNNGINNSKIQNTVNYILTGLNNSNAAGRWLNNITDKADSYKDYLKQKMEDWWDYEGGKQLVKGVAIGVLEVVAGVAAVVGAVAVIVAGGWTVGLVATLVAGAIGAINGVVNIVNEARGYHETNKNNDPAMGRRRSNENSAQDYWRRETDSKFWHGVASGIDIAETVCGIVSFLNSGRELLKNMYKWTTGSMADVANLRLKNILTKENGMQFLTKIKDNVSIGWKEVKSAFKFKNFDVLGDFFFDFGDDFLNNLKQGYANFENLQKGAGSVKSWAGLGKTFVEGGFNFKNIVINMGIQTLVLPNLNLAEVVTYSPGEMGGVFDYDISHIKVMDMPDLIKDMIELPRTVFDILDGDSIVGKNVMKKFSSFIDLDISIPAIHIPTTTIPQISMPRINVAVGGI